MKYPRITVWHPTVISAKGHHALYVEADKLLDRLRRMRVADGAPIDDLINELEEECS